MRRRRGEDRVMLEERGPVQCGLMVRGRAAVQFVAPVAATVQGGLAEVCHGAVATAQEVKFDFHAASLPALVGQALSGQQVAPRILPDLYLKRAAQAGVFQSERQARRTVLLGHSLR